MREWRKLHSSLIESARLASLSDSAAILFCLLVAAQDDTGWYPWEPTKIRRLTLARPWSTDQTLEYARELVNAGMASFEEGGILLRKGKDLNGHPRKDVAALIYSRDVNVTSTPRYESVSLEKSRVEKSRGEENLRAVDEIFRQKMRERFGSIITGLDARIDDALEYDMNRSPSKRAKNVQQFVRNWLLKDVDRITAMKENTNGRVQQVNERKLRGDATGWAWRTKSG